MTVHLMGNTVIPTDQERKSKIDPASLKDLFSDGIPQIAKEESIKRRTPVKDITPENLRKLESIDIKNMDWEQVKPAQKIGDTINDMGAIRPARSECETNDGGTGLIPGAMDSIFEKPQESEFSQHAIAAGKQKREERANRGKPSQEARDEWEVVAKAPNTADVQVTDRGVMPNRSAFEPGEIPKVRISTVEKITAQNKKSAEAGVKAAELKTELDQIMMDKMHKVSNNWEDEAFDKIQETATKKSNVGFEKVKFAQDFVTPEAAQKKATKNLDGLFAIPQNPADVPDEKIRRNVDKLRTRRQKREDDRSWEAVVRSSKTRRV